MSLKDSTYSSWDVLPVTISNGTSLTGTIDLKGLRLFSIGMPSAWTAASLTFQVSPDAGTTWLELYDSSGNAITATANPSTSISLSPSQFAPFEFLRVRSGTASTPVNQGADRQLQLILRSV